MHCCIIKVDLKFFNLKIGLGQLYLTGGRGVERDVELASHYFSAAAESGSSSAHAHLGKMYLDGTTATPQDNQTAFQFFKKAADRVLYFYFLYSLFFFWIFFVQIHFYGVFYIHILHIDFKEMLELLKYFVM